MRLLAAAAVSLFGSAGGTTQHSITIPTTSGAVIGHQAPNSNYVTEYLGIRYAEAPVDELRFSAPKKLVSPRGAVFEASDWSPDCPANRPPLSNFPIFTQRQGLRIWKNFAAYNNDSVSEDCLKLNVWTQHPGDAKAKKPVLLFIHGGRFQIPGPHSPLYQGQYLSDAEDVVVVTINYRLGIFGFSGAPGVDANPALLDHRAAVEWVRDNIIGFGGDPSRIVIFGQSAGGASIDYWSFAYRKDSIVSGLVSMSGTSLSFLPNTQEYSRSIWHNVTLSIGCGGPEDDPTAVLSCVRSKNISVILAASARVPTLFTQALSQPAFHPIVDNITVFADYEQLSASGAFARIPFLVGSADSEDGWYRLGAYTAKVNLTNIQWDLFDQRAFTCPTADASNYRAQHDVPTWRYRYFGDWDNLRLYNGSAGLRPGGSGSYHGSDLNMVFGTAEDNSGLPNSPQENEMIRYMQGAWTAFATDSKSGLTRYGWPEYKKGDKTLAQLALKNDPRPSFVNPAVYDALCPRTNDPLPGRGAF